MQPRVIAHRGASLEEPENSMSAFDRAIEVGADMIELDVRMTQDGVAIIMHDETIDRTTNGTGKISELPWLQIRQVTLKSKEESRHGHGPSLHVPALEEVLEFSKNRIGLNIELKDYSPALAARILDIIDSTGFPIPDLIISSFDFDVLRWIGERRSDIALASLFSGLPPSIDELPGTWVHPRFTCVDADAMAAFRRLGRKVNAWTVNDPVKQQELIDLGVDGIITDDPKGLIDLIRALP